MSTTLLAAFPSPPQGVWHLGPFPLRAYALCIIVGIIAALIIGDRRWEARGGERGVIYDIALWAVPFGLIGGRVYHVLTDWEKYFGPEGAGFGAALKIWEGGLGIWGAVALGGVGAWIGCRRRGIPLPAFGDAIAPGIVLAQAIGRLGNYFNQELYGRPTDLPWGMEVFYRVDPSGIVDVNSLNGVSNGEVAYVVHPTFLYELLWNLLVFALLIYVDRRFKIGHGRLFALYVAGYCIGRFGVELMRDDFATLIAGIRINSFTATFVFIGAIVYFILAPKGREAPETLRGNAPESEGVVEKAEKEVVAAAATTGAVAAATVAADEEKTADEDPANAETTALIEQLDAEPAPEPEPVDEDDLLTAEVPADEPDLDEPELDEADREAEVTAGGDVVVETDAEAEEAQLIDEDHDPVDEEDLESLDEPVAVGAPVSEQQEELDEPDAKVEVDEQAAEEEEAAEGEALIEEPEAEVTAGGDVVVETEAEADAEAEEAQLIDEDHDPVDEEDLESLDEPVAVGAPVSEQQEELDEPDAKVEVDEQAAEEEEAVEGEALIEEPEAEAEEAQLIDEDHDPVDADDLESFEEPAEVVAPASEQQEELDEPDAGEEEAAEGEAETAEDDNPFDEPEEQPAESASSASDYAVVTEPQPDQQQGSRLSRLLRRRR
ncbi:prolipoprotein diacylglyceryl transferase [Mycobacterium sp. MS1601]|uniref:prolipoprotein diacylglyceryl transferase n=1 Tax=Mycobacterium sp. MS1601 TaxID=1936029 RepID=UPI00097952C2|nr:prolipoprotein diacylglyceryl transferase [Mycobacterium sp. MS1601]AQA05564.1 prolipoprotein diacylglyceryl transferase [Mycobacterium sp. MS1601]